mmetsp:Transcript_44061/g.89962  ORF Transcript_44061/g.89962 Transcript_44061/m.89962 type:complete len:224 (-) Transcript_44061:77-748(-)
MPAALTGGSSTDTTVLCGVKSTPVLSAVKLSRGFFLAFMMLGSVAYRGSFSRRSAVSTAGRDNFSSSLPASVSLLTTALCLSSATLKELAKLHWGQLKRPASIWPVWQLSASMDCLPKITKSPASLSVINFRALATASGCTSWSVRKAVSIWMALSAPIAKAVRRVSWQALGPTDTATISVAIFFSFKRIASSMAISQKGFMDIFTLVKSTPVLSGRTRTFTA